MSENIDWRYWAAAGTTTLDEASLLSLGLEPPAPSRYNEDLTGEAANRVSMAGRYLQSNVSVDWLIQRHERACQDVGKSLVSLHEFGAWLKSAGYDLPCGFPLPLNAAPSETLENTAPTDGEFNHSEAISTTNHQGDDEHIAALFDPVGTAQLEKMFPSAGGWEKWAAKAKEKGLTVARVGRAKFNPYRAALWWLDTQNPEGWDWARCCRKLAGNLPNRSADFRHLLTGDPE